jgi:hypothetical protein
MRATKITKYFQSENTEPLYFFPVKNKKSNNTTNNTDSELSTPPSIKNKEPSSFQNSSFDSVNIQLETKYYQIGSTLEYGVYFNNNTQLDIKGSITNVGGNIVGDLMALHEALKYIVYNPNLSQKLNKYKFNIYTNSKTIANIYKPDANYIDSTVYFKIQSLLKCIKNISIEFWTA